MVVKAFEIRDRGTFIPAMGILMVPTVLTSLSGPGGAEDWGPNEAERYLLRRAGFADGQLVVLVRMECSGTDRHATYDPFAWGQNPRTFFVAHRYIQENWDELQSGAVICVEHILGERETPKESERVT